MSVPISSKDGKKTRNKERKGKERNERIEEWKAGKRQMVSCGKLTCKTI
jgi:hypothetical protein